MEHTPGPWHIGRRLTVYSDKDGSQIADCNQITNMDDENKANARLIAASPDLLEACEKTFRVLEAEFGPRVAEINFSELIAAIAKAKGE